MNHAKSIGIEDLKNAKQQILDAVNAVRDNVRTLSGGQMHLTTIDIRIETTTRVDSSTGVRRTGVSTMLLGISATFQGPDGLKIVM